MPLIYSKDEIKDYLMGRGFDITDEEIINKFIHDLKKMVKYEERKRRRKKLGHDSQETNLDSTAQSPEGVENNVDNSGKVIQKSISEIEDDEDESLSRLSSLQHQSAPFNQDVLDGFKSYKSPVKTRPQATQASVPRKESRQLSVHIDNKIGKSKKTSSKPTSGGRVVMTRKTYKENGDSSFVEESVVEVGGRERNPPEQRHRPRTATGGPEHKVTATAYGSKPYRHSNTEIPPVNRATKSPHPSTSTDNMTLEQIDDDELLRLFGQDWEEDIDPIKSAAATRAILGPSDRVKRDPVALYHYYKRIWSKQKIPGEDRHMKLRWNVRAHTVGNFPCVEGRPVKYLR